MNHAEVAPFVSVAATLVVASTFALRADVTGADAELQYQLGSLLFDETRYQRSDRRVRPRDAQRRPGAGDPRAQGQSARRAADRRVRCSPRGGRTALRTQPDAERNAVALMATRSGRPAVRRGRRRVSARPRSGSPGSSRAQFGRARIAGGSSAGSTRRSTPRLTASAAVAARRRDSRAGRRALRAAATATMQAASAYTQLHQSASQQGPQREGGLGARAGRVPRVVQGVTPVEIDRPTIAKCCTRCRSGWSRTRSSSRDASTVAGAQDFMLDTGSEETVISARDGAARAHPAGDLHVSAGVGEVGLRGLQLARLKSLELGTLQVRNVPVLVKNPGAARHPEARRRELLAAVARDVDDDRLREASAHDRPQAAGRRCRLPPADADPPPGDGARHAEREPPGLLRRRHRRRGDFDQLGHGGSLPPSPYRRIPLRVWGTSGWDRDAFLLPGVDLDFDRIEYRNFPLVVLNLRAPSLLLGFQLGGIVGHKFLVAVPRVDGHGEERAAAGEILRNSQLPIPNAQASWRTSQAVSR